MKKNDLRKIPFSSGKKWFCISLISMIVLSAYNLIISWQLQKIIDVAAGIDDTPLYLVAAISLFSFVLFIIFYYVFRFAHPKFLQTASSAYKEFLFSKILRNNNGLINKNGTGDIISKLTNDLSSIENHYFDFYINLIDIGVSFIGAVVLMLWYSPILTLIAISLSILPILISIPASKQITKTEKHLSNENASFVEFVRDTLSGYFVIKSFNAEQELGQRFNDENKNIETAKFLRRFAEENINLLSTAASVIMRIGVFLFGAWLSLSDTNITPGIVLVFLQLVTFVISPIERIPSLFANRNAAISIIDKASDLINEHYSNKASTKIDTLSSEIEIRNLSFSYEPTSQVLNNISLKFKAGKKYAIVGTSGSGKTTLFNLLSKHSDDYKGEILFDGVELREIAYSSIYNIISVIHQNVFVFNDSIYNNIT
ncbi:MAG: ABC transporter ATP-binding protein, partial [Eubacteriales bacterium]|nr:ABC transporter ATP-binding protein [Eubacteriales bacterium]